MHAAASDALFEDFLGNLRQFYEEQGRHDMLWRQPEADGSFDPYRILVSELMLQQTQVSRVTPKYELFISRFPTVQSLAAASLGEVLGLWSGLGYNRRAKYLHGAAAAVVGQYDGIFPDTVAELQKLPGVGPNTAGALMAYAYNNTVVYLETNIRTVLLYHFYAGRESVTDNDLRETLSQIVKTSPFHEVFTPREFYWAMMDYGAHLKKSVGNLNYASKSYYPQSAFAGSRRQVRGMVLKLLTERPLSAGSLAAEIGDERLASVLQDLLAERLIRFENGVYELG